MFELIDKIYICTGLMDHLQKNNWILKLNKDETESNQDLDEIEVFF